MVNDLKLFRGIGLITCSVVEKDTFLTRVTPQMQDLFLSASRLARLPSRVLFRLQLTGLIRSMPLSAD